MKFKGCPAKKSCTSECAICVHAANYKHLRNQIVALKYNLMKLGAENERLKAKRDAVQHGQWVEKIITTRTFEEVEVQTSIECSVCGRRYWDTPGYDLDNGVYPPSCLCGAKMDAQEGAEHVR